MGEINPLGLEETAHKQFSAYDSGGLRLYGTAGGVGGGAETESGFNIMLEWQIIAADRQR